MSHKLPNDKTISTFDRRYALQLCAHERFTIEHAERRWAWKSENQNERKIEQEKTHSIRMENKPGSRVKREREREKERDRRKARENIFRYQMYDMSVHAIADNIRSS